MALSRNVTLCVTYLSCYLTVFASHRHSLFRWNFQTVIQSQARRGARLSFVKRDHCTALWAVQHPSMTPTGFVSVVC